MSTCVMLWRLMTGSHTNNSLIKFTIPLLTLKKRMNQEKNSSFLEDNKILE